MCEISYDFRQVIFIDFFSFFFCDSEYLTTCVDNQHTFSVRSGQNI